MALQGPASPGQQAILLLGPQPTVQGAAASQGWGKGCSPPPTQALRVWMQECWSGHMNRRKKQFLSHRPRALCLPDPSSSPAYRLAGCATLSKALRLWMSSFPVFLVCTEGTSPGGVVCGLKDTPLLSSHREPGQAML